MILGVAGMLAAASFDLFRSETPQFGILQQAGFVVAAFVAVAGLRRAALSAAWVWDGLLLSAYLAGTFFMGLRSGSRHHFRYHVRRLLSDTHIIPSDVAINLLGFIPLGYLMMSFVRAVSRSKNAGGAMALSVGLCALVSLGIEVAQAYLPGRSSSLIDLGVNTAGALIGVWFCRLESRVLPS